MRRPPLACLAMSVGRRCQTARRVLRLESEAAHLASRQHKAEARAARLGRRLEAVRMRIRALQVAPSRAQPKPLTHSQEVGRCE
jgi:hypothetical protein